MKLINHIDNVNSILNIGDRTFYKKKGLYYFSGNEVIDLNIPDGLDIVYSALNSDGDRLYGIRGAGQGFRVINEYGKVNYESHQSDLSGMQPNLLLETMVHRKVTRSVSLNNWKLLQEWSFCVPFWSVFGEFAIGFNFYDKREVVCVNLKELAVKWTYHIAPKRGVQDGLESDNRVYYVPDKVIGVHNGVVFIVLRSGLVIGLDLTSGLLKYEILHATKTPEGYVRGKEHENHHNKLLQVDSNGLFGIHTYYYMNVVMSGDTLAYEMHDIRESQKLYNVAPASSALNSWPVNESIIYFGHSSKSEYHNNIGAFDRSTLRIIDAVDPGVTELNRPIDRIRYLHPSISSMTISNRVLYIHIRQQGSGELYVYDLNKFAIDKD